MHRYLLEFLGFFAVFMLAFALYQLPDAPTKFIYYNF